MAIGVSLYYSQVFDVSRSRNAGTWLNAFIVASHYSTGFFEIQVFSCRQFGAVSVFVNCVNSSFRGTNGRGAGGKGRERREKEKGKGIRQRRIKVTFSYTSAERKEGRR
jgi:hypothetical protein